MTYPVALLLIVCNYVQLLIFVVVTLIRAYTVHGATETYVVSTFGLFHVATC